MYALIHASKGDYRKAIDACQQVFKLDGSIEGLKLSAKYAVAQS